MSGSALSPWSLTEYTQDPAGPTRRLADAVGCNCSSAPTLFDAISLLNATPVNSTAANVKGANTELVYVSHANSTATSTATNMTASPPSMAEIIQCLRTKTVADIVYGTARLQVRLQSLKFRHILWTSSGLH